MSDISFSGFPVFDAQGNMLGNQTSAQGQVPAINAPEITGSNLTNGISGTTVSTPPNGASVPSTAATNPGAAASTTAANAPPGPTSGSLSDYFARAVIIVLGFIFIAVGLNMLRPGTIAIPTPIKP